MILCEVFSHAWGRSQPASQSGKVLRSPSIALLERRKHFLLCFLRVSSVGALFGKYIPQSTSTLILWGLTCEPNVARPSVDGLMDFRVLYGIVSSMKVPTPTPFLPSRILLHEWFLWMVPRFNVSFLNHDSVITAMSTVFCFIQDVEVVHFVGETASICE